MEAPDWFTAALAVPCSEGRVDVGGGSIHYLAWGEPGRRGLVQQSWPEAAQADLTIHHLHGLARRLAVR